MATIRIREASDLRGDEADFASEREQEFLGAALRAALARSDEPVWTSADGTRICRRCYEPIPKERLTAIPSAVRCFDCQQEMELIQAVERRSR
ncbi:DnaK suppressor protein [Gammaproteobacteria bacterium]